jgi:hypothetical protein
MPIAYLRPERLTLKSHPELDERWIQDRIAEDPSILGLGDLVLSDKERAQPGAGVLDLLFHDPKTNRRYEVEVQLGATDPSHIIRTIEYWDIERKRYPQYDHCAVLVAEDITARFLNVISLFNGAMPLVALQMQALKVGENTTLVFTTVMDERKRGPIEGDGGSKTVTRSDFEKKYGSVSTGIADRLLEIAHELDSSLDLYYTRRYFGLAKNGRPSNFIRFLPRKNGLVLAVRLKQSGDIERKIDEARLVRLGYDAKRRRYKFRLTKDEPKEHAQILHELIRLAHESWSG